MARDLVHPSVAFVGCGAHGCSPVDGTWAMARPRNSLRQARAYGLGWSWRPAPPLPGLWSGVRTPALPPRRRRHHKHAAAAAVEQTPASPEEKVRPRWQLPKKTPGPSYLLGCLSLWAWPWLVGSLFEWTRRLRPFFEQKPLLEVLFYLTSGLLLLQLAARPEPVDASQTARQAVWFVFERVLGCRKWLAEMISLSISSFMASASRAMLFFVGVNLCVNSIPDGWSARPPAFLRMSMMLPKDGVLRATHVELFVFKWSQKVLLAFLISILGLSMLRMKHAPKTPVPVEQSFFGEKGLFRIPNLAAVMFARQNPRRKRSRVLNQRLALPEKIFEGVFFFGLVVWPWMYLLGLRLQTVLAIGGVGGLAVGLAAKNVVGNLISGVLITLNRPFVEGDEIDAGGKGKLQGIVDDIGLTATRINQLDGCRVQVPNSRLLDDIVVNRTDKHFRMFKHEIPVVLPDMSALPDLVQGIQRILEGHPDILQQSAIAELKIRKEYKLKLFPPACTFAGYGDLGAKLSILAYTVGRISSAEFLAVQSDVMLKVNDYILDGGASIGFASFTQVPGIDWLKPDAEPGMEHSVHQPADAL